MVARISIAAFSFTLLTLPSLALAQEATAPVPTGPTLFPTMGADGSESSFTAQIGIVDAGGEGDETILNLALSGQFVNEAGLGGYAAISGTKAGEAEAMGSLEIGGLWRRSETTGSNSDLAVRIGVILPTARIDEDSDTFFSDFFLNLAGTALTRPSDYLRSVPETTTVRAAVTPSIRSGNFVARADVGIDYILDSFEDDELDAPFIHLDVGAGYDDGRATALFEMSNMIYTDDTDETLHLAAFSAGYHAQGATPYLTVQMPFGDLVDDETVINLMAGLRGHL